MGYEVQRFQDDVADFLCPICWNVLEDPTQIKQCEHMFCLLCIGTWMHRSLTCPVDRMQIKESHLRDVSRFFRMQYSRLKIRCQFVEHGCAQTVQVEKIMDHESICPFNDERSAEGTVSESVNELHKNLIEALKVKGNIKSRKVENAMLAVDRGLFCIINPYVDRAKGIGYGATISAPHMHGAVLELLRSKLTEGAKVLDIGSGSGYLTICMAMMLGSNGKAIGIEHVSQLVKESKRQIRQNFNYLNNSRIEFITRDGRDGYATEGPYDAINIGGAIDKVPQTIIDQLKPNGRIVVPLICAEGQILISIDKLSNGEVKMKKRERVRFGLITDLWTQLN